MQSCMLACSSYIICYLWFNDERPLGRMCPNASGSLRIRE